MPEPTGRGSDQAATGSPVGGQDEPVVAMVKFYDAARGFGFVIAACRGGDAILHGTVLRRDGLDDPSQGDRIRCVIGPGPRGLQVCSILGIEPACPGRESGEGGQMPGRVKFYDPSRGYGFITADSGEEVFVGAKLLRKLGLTPLRDDQAVRVTVSRGERGLVAETLTFGT